MNDDYERLQLQTKKKYVLDTFRNGLRCIPVMRLHCMAWNGCGAITSDRN